MLLYRAAALPTAHFTGGAGTVDGAAAALFAAGIAARTKGPIIWCLTRPDLFFPALAQVGLHSDRVIFVESDKDEDVLANMEEVILQHSPRCDWSDTKLAEVRNFPLKMT